MTKTSRHWGQRASQPTASASVCVRLAQCGHVVVICTDVPLIILLIFPA
jgi:hypothetical protein